MAFGINRSMIARLKSLVSKESPSYFAEIGDDIDLEKEGKIFLETDYGFSPSQRHIPHLKDGALY